MTPIRPLANGKTRLSSDPDKIMLCPRCGDVLVEPFVAVSRVFQHTKICPQCGQDEGLLQTAGQDASWRPIIYKWRDQVANYEKRINKLETEYDELQDEITRSRRDYSNLQARYQKNQEVIFQLTDKLKYADEQLRELLGGLLKTEDT